MNSLRGTGLTGTVVRSFALFAFLIQFTIPFAVALAAGLHEAAHPRLSEICWGVSGDFDADMPEKPFHGKTCPVPGGCCPLGIVERLEPLQDGDLSAVMCRADTRASAFAPTECLFQSPMPRGPPDRS